MASKIVGAEIKYTGSVQNKKQSKSGGVILIAPTPDSPKKIDIALVHVASAQMRGGVAQMPIRVIGRVLILEGVFPTIDAESATEIRHASRPQTKMPMRLNQTHGHFSMML